MSPEELESLLSRAERNLKTAANLIEDGDYDVALSRAYYSMFYAATAALLYRGIKRSHHSGVIAAFGQELVNSGILSPNYQKMLQEAFADRCKSDYQGVFPTRGESQKCLEKASKFVGAVKKYLQDEGLQV